MAFSNPIVGGENLVIPGIQSPNYTAGVSGWRIARDGTVEFNSGTFRGSVVIGNPAGQHAIIANPATGDPIDVYNTSGQLVFSIDATGRLVSYSSVGTANVVLNGGSLFFEDTAQNPFLPPEEQGVLSAIQTILDLDSGIPQNAPGGISSANLQLITGITQASARIQATQEGISGLVMQAVGTGGQLRVGGVYSATVSGAAGVATFNHNCPFTPTGGTMGPLTHFSQWNWVDTFGTHGFTATQAQATFFQPAGNFVGNGVTPTFHGDFWS